MPRWLHKIRAFLGGYFWLDCDLCGEKFGGHESHRCESLMSSPGLGTLTCPNCKEETIKRNIENGHARFVEINPQTR